MTEEEARNKAQALAVALGITFYVVRSADRQFLAVQQAAHDSEIIATLRRLFD